MNKKEIKKGNQEENNISLIFNLTVCFKVLAAPLRGTSNGYLTLKGTIDERV